MDEPHQPGTTPESDAKVPTDQPSLPARPIDDSAEMPPGPVTSDPPKKSKKRFVFAAIVAGAALLLFAGGVAAYNYLYQSPDKVVTDAIINASRAQSVIFTGLLDTTGNQKVKIEVNGGIKDTGGLMNAKATFKAGGKVVTVEGAAIVDANNTLYVKVKNAKSIVTNTLGGYATAFDAIITKIDNKWVKISTDNFSEYSANAKKTKQCIDQTVTKFKGDTAAIAQVTDAYKANQFIVITKQLPSRDGSLGYELTFDDTKTAAFMKAFMQTSIYKHLHTCDGSMFPDTYTPQSNTGAKPVIQLWISRFGHEITELVTDINNGKSTTHIAIQTLFNKQVTVEAPTEFVTIDELQQDINELYNR